MIGLAGCAAPSTQYTEVKQGNVKPATLEQVKNCEYLDDIIVTSVFIGAAAAWGSKNARAEVINNAASIGATHIVWLSPIRGERSVSAGGKAYRCAG